MKRIIAFALLTAAAVALHAQSNDPVVVEIAGQPIRKSEFMKEFLRSVGKDVNATPGVCTFEKREALNNYVELFTNFRTKLYDAYQHGMDTTAELRNELATYRKEVAAPYLIDSATLDRLLHEAYERNHYALHAAHILVPCTPFDSPSDTAVAYKMAWSFYRRALEGETFWALARQANEFRFKLENIPPDDPRRQDNGDLGCFTVFDMVYPFENIAYSLEPGEISEPGRTNYGYHVVKLFSKTPYFGNTSFQHIWVAERENASTAEFKIRSAYEQLAEGQDFNVVCRNYSDDHRTMNNGGLLANMSVNQLPPEYLVELSRLQPGEVSAPFHTSHGWHIVKLVKRENIPPFEEMLPIYKKRMARDQRNKETRTAFIEQSKAKYNFTDFTEAYIETIETPLRKKGKKNEPKEYMASLDESVALLNDSVFMKMWRFEPSKVTDKRPLFRVGDNDYTTADLLRYIEQHMRPEEPYELRSYVEKKYQEFINYTVLAYADSHLEAENQEFRELMDEYRNGLMIFSYNEKYIWSKAILDTTGFDDFYWRTLPTHRFDDEDAANYWWNDRAKVRVVQVADSNLLKPSVAAKLLKKAEKAGWDDGQLLAQLQAKAKQDSTLDKPLSVELQTVERDNQQLLKASQWRPGLHGQPSGRGYRLMFVEQLIDAMPKSKLEARGFYVNDYQNYIEQQLLEQLKKQYNVKIHWDTVEEITY